MVCLGDVVGHQRRQQRVDRSKQCQHQTGLDQFRQMLTEVRHHESKPSLRNGADAVQRFQSQRLQPVVVEQQQRQRSHDQQGQQWGWHPLTDPCRCQEDHRKGHDADAQRRRVWQWQLSHRGQTADDSSCCGYTDEGADLQDQDDEADAGHESRNHRIGHQGDEAPQTKHSQQCLEDAADRDCSHDQRQHFSGREV